MVAEPNPGWAAGIGQRSRVKQLAWALKGAPLRKKDLKLNALSGIAEARKLRDRVTNLMVDASANPDDAVVLCVFSKPDMSALVPTFAAELGANATTGDIALAAQHAEDFPIGLMVFVYDREGSKSVFGHVRPLVVEDARGIELNAQALRVYERVLRKRLMLSGEIPDERN